MRRPGRPSTVTAAQRAEIHLMHQRGASQRVIARNVFGDERFHGRVERELARQAPPVDVPDPSPEQVREFLGGLDWRTAFRERFEEIAAARREHGRP